MVAEAAAKAQRQAQREAEKEWDNFDYWLAKVEARVRDIKSSYVPPHVQAARDEFAALAWGAWGEDVPFEESRNEQATRFAGNRP